jgi:D-sedoheptulose 7-phosphate isomerase
MKQIQEIIKILKNHKGYIFLCGNGGSSSIASHLANDYVKMNHLKALCLTDNIPLITAISNDIDYENIFVEQLKIFGCKDDILMVFSGSGDSMNILKSLAYGKSLKMKTIAFIGTDGGTIKDCSSADIIVYKKGDMQDSEDNFMKWGHYIVKELCK